MTIFRPQSESYRSDSPNHAFFDGPSRTRHHRQHTDTEDSKIGPSNTGNCTGKHLGRYITRNPAVDLKMREDLAQWPVRDYVCRTRLHDPSAVRMSTLGF